MTEMATMTGGALGTIEKIDIQDTTVDLNKVSELTRHFLDPADQRQLMTIIFKPHKYLSFLRNWLAMGIDDQKEKDNHPGNKQNQHDRLILPYQVNKIG